MHKKPQIVFTVDALMDTVNVLTYLLYKKPDAKQAKLLKDTLHIDIKRTEGMSRDEKYNYILETITPIYEAKLPYLKQKVSEYQEYYDANANFINYELEQTFHVKLKGTQVITAYVSINPISTFDYSNLAFDVHAGKNEDVMTTTIRRILNIYWCELWQDNNPKFDPDQFEYPNLEWLLSEIAIDPIIYYSRLNQICNPKPVDSHYYQVRYGSQSFIDVIRKLYKSNSIVNFMEHGLEFLKDNPKLVNVLLKK